MSRRAARESALQVLFQIDIGKTGIDDAIAFVAEENGLNEKQEQFIRGLVPGVLNKLEKLDRIICEISIDWDMGRMAVVDKNIIRLGLYEVLYSADVPPSVAVNEAVELGKKFGSAESSKFINGILGKVIGNIDKFKTSETGV